MAGELPAEPVGDRGQQPVLAERDVVDIVLVEPAAGASGGSILVGKKCGLEQLVEPARRP